MHMCFSIGNSQVAYTEYTRKTYNMQPLSCILYRCIRNKRKIGEAGAGGGGAGVESLLMRIEGANDATIEDAGVGRIDGIWCGGGASSVVGRVRRDLGGRCGGWRVCARSLDLRCKWRCTSICE